MRNRLLVAAIMLIGARIVMGDPADGKVVVLAGDGGRLVREHDLRPRYAHKTLALNAGLNVAVIDDIQAGRRPNAMRADEKLVYDFSLELRERRRVSDATFKAAVSVLGERGVMDLIAAMGYYDLVSMVLNVDRYPLPEGAHAPFPEPK